ncbi:universal stress protein [Streptomyces sp. NA02950]|uniref:universal stress protein n=1 Tax=Streptomyces sp. NA02950 TaxID=2742137 RepID=UPI001591A46A|nr:universal stress protein [Streptomyces sp. NA02950]QKV90594.1 universal stress protein [Streptomyces sp. NA02950]
MGTMDFPLVVGVDRADPSLHSVDWAVDEERAPTDLTDALSQAVREYPQVKMYRTPVEGPAHKALLEGSADADLIVVGALMRRGHFGPQSGRVAHALARHSECAVAIIPQRA